MESKTGKKWRPPLLFALAGLAAAAAFTAGTGLLRPTEANPSALLDTVKSNPAKAETLCQQLKTINAGGLSVYSSTGLGQVAASQGITTADAEIFVTYVVGLYCPDVT